MFIKYLQADPSMKQLASEDMVLGVCSLHVKANGTHALHIDLHLFSSEVSLHSLTATPAVCVHFEEMKTNLRNIYFSALKQHCQKRLTSAGHALSLSGIIKG